MDEDRRHLERRRLQGEVVRTTMALIRMHLNSAEVSTYIDL